MPSVNRRTLYRSTLSKRVISRRLAITAGDPCGIGPEVILKALSMVHAERGRRLLVIGDLTVFTDTARRLQITLPAWRILGRSGSSSDLGRLPELFDAPLAFLDRGSHTPFRLGYSSKQAGQAALWYLETAVRLWRQGMIDGLVTAPVTKWAIAQSRRGFVGQTEYLAGEMRVRDVAMMFAADALRVVLLTRHVPLNRVSRLLTPALVRRTTRLTVEALQRQFGIARPKVAFCGVNPHAGEASQCGHEEQRVFISAIRALRRQGVLCQGPFAADGLFPQAMAYDVVVCAYHDQGLIPFKLLARDRGCQVSLGLPIVRTSPDHGSALDIAGEGIADPGSMCYALRLAMKLADRAACTMACQARKRAC